MEVAVLSGHICNWGLSLLYAKRSELVRPLDWVTSFRERLKREPPRAISSAQAEQLTQAEIFFLHTLPKLSSATPYSGTGTSKVKSL
jgi:hypothetical protein